MTDFPILTVSVTNAMGAGSELQTPLLKIEHDVPGTLYRGFVNFMTQVSDMLDNMSDQPYEIDLRFEIGDEVLIVFPATGPRELAGAVARILLMNYGVSPLWPGEPLTEYTPGFHDETDDPLLRALLETTEGVYYDVPQYTLREWYKHAETLDAAPEVEPEDEDEATAAIEELLRWIEAEANKNEPDYSADSIIEAIVDQIRERILCDPETYDRLAEVVENEETVYIDVDLTLEITAAGE